MSSSPTSRLVAVYLAALVLAAYANSVDVGFRFDDWHALEQNPAIRSLANLPRFFVDPSAATVLPENEDLRPVLLTTFALNYAISGERPWSWHALNLVLHWLVVLFVFRIVRDHLWLGPDRIGIAAAAAVIVAVHPLATEAVDYLSARSALLTTALYLAAFDAGVRDRRARTVLLFVLALLTKAIAVTLPLVLLAHALLDRRRGRPGVGWRFIGVLGALAVAALVYRALLVPPRAMRATHDAAVGPGTYFMTEWSAYLYYLRLFLWPDALTVDRLDYPIVRSLLAPQAWGSLLALAGLGGLARWARDRRPALAFAACWYALTLAPESTIFPLAEPVNEHRPYLALLGPATAAACGLWALAAVVARGAPVRRRPAFVLLAAVVTTTLAIATVRRNETWRDDVALWMDAVGKAPANPRAWLNAGHAAMVAGDDRNAERLLLEAHRRDPCYAYVQINLSALAARRNGEESLRWAEEAVACNPDMALAHRYRAGALERLGGVREALVEYRRTTAIDARDAEAWRGQARLLEGQGAWAEAAAADDRAFAADPTLAETAMHAALLYHYRLRDPAAAVERYRRVLRLVPAHYGAHYQLAVALLATGARGEARTAWRTFETMASAIGDRASVDIAPVALRAP